MVRWRDSQTTCQRVLVCYEYLLQRPAAMLCVSSGERTSQCCVQVKKHLREERKARVRVEQVRAEADRTEWQAELRRLGFK